MPLDYPLLAVFGGTVVLGIIALAFGSRALAILRRPPTGEASRELVFLTGRDLIPPLIVVASVVALEFVEWALLTLEPAGVIALPNLARYMNLTQAFLLLMGGVMAYQVLVPYTRARRFQRSRITLDRLAARVALLKGRR